MMTVNAEMEPSVTPAWGYAMALEEKPRLLLLLQ